MDSSDFALKSELGAGDADTVDGLHADAIPGTAGFDFVAIESSSVNFEVPDPVQLAAVEIIAPSSGWALVRFDGLAYADTGDLLVLAASDDGDWEPNSGNTGINGSGSPSEGTPFSHTRAYPVTAGAHTFYAVGQNWVETAGNGIGSVYGHLTVEFFPSRL